MTKIINGKSTIYNLKDILADYRKNGITDKEYDNLIKILCSGKNSPVLTKNVSYNFFKSYDELFINLFELKIPTEKQIDLIIDCAINIDIDIDTYEWINHLVAVNYIFSKKQALLLLKLGYVDNIDKYDIDGNTKLDQLFKSKHLVENINLIETIVTKYKIQLTNDHFKTIIETIAGIGYCSPAALKQLLNLMNKLIELGLVLDITSLNTYVDVVDEIDNNYIYKDLLKLLLTRCIMTDEIFDKILEMHAYDHIQSIFDYGYIPKNNIFLLIDWNVFSDYLYEEESIKDFMNMLIDKYNIKLTTEIIEYACTLSCKELFKLCIKHEIYPTIECLYKICSSESLDETIIETIIDQKIIPDEQCMILLTQNDNVSENVISLLLQNGAPLTYTVIENIFDRDYIDILDNIVIDDYGINYDEKIYELCHKYMLYHDKLINKLAINKNMLELRQLCLASKEPVIIKYKEKYNLEYDHYCYDNILCNEKYELYYNAYDHKIIMDAINTNQYKPTILSILRIPNERLRLRLYGKFMHLI